MSAYLPDGELPTIIYYDDNGNPITKPTGTTTTTGKKWWESIVGVLPALVAGIFGATSPPVNTSPYVQPTQPTSTGINTTTVLIIAAAAIVFVLYSGKGKK